MITRRNFLKGAALSAGAMVLNDQLLDFKSWAKTHDQAPVTQVPTFCNACGNRCGCMLT